MQQWLPQSAVRPFLLERAGGIYGSLSWILHAAKCAAKCLQAECLRAWTHKMWLTMFEVGQRLRISLQRT
jgi:hypothetical protein